jgi:hypothetical protein
MPNIAILREQFSSKFLDAVVDSNDAKARSLGSPPATTDIDGKFHGVAIR